MNIFIARKAVVPEKMAEHIEKCKEASYSLLDALYSATYDIQEVFIDLNGHTQPSLKERLKYRERQELYADAWVNGYRVGKKN